MTRPVETPAAEDRVLAQLYADGCPACVNTTNPPLTMTRLGGEMACTYRCPCGHRWSTRRNIAYVEGW